MGTSPDDILAAFKAQNGTVSSGMNHDMGGMDHGMSPLGDAGDVTYPPTTSSTAASPPRPAP